MSRGPRAGATRMITEAGIYHGMPDAVYHADPVIHTSLSSTEIRLLIDCPARFRWYRDHGQLETRDMRVGKAVHRVVLGQGPDIIVLTDPKGADYTDFKSPKCRELRDTLSAAGCIPVLRKELDLVDAMAAAILAHPDASRIFCRPGGRPEVVGVVQEPETGVWLRAKFDYLPPWSILDYRVILPDMKSAESATEDAIRNSIVNYGYWVQAATYLLVLYLLGHGAGPLDDRFVLIVQEKSPPYIVTPAVIDPGWVSQGVDIVIRACRTYLECTRTGRWPAYTDDVVTIGPPRWWNR